MKLLHAVVRLCNIGRGAAPHRTTRVPHDFRVTVPAPLVRRAVSATEPAGLRPAPSP